MIAMKAIGKGSAVLLLCICMLLVSALSCAETLRGTGSKADPYRIGTAAQLHEFAWRVNNNNNNRETSACAILTADIDYSAYADTWYAIGSQNYPYNGIFDGAGKTISGLALNDKNGFNAFIRVLGEAGQVRNLTVEASFAGNGLSGGIAGRSFGTIVNCTFSGSLSMHTDISSDVYFMGGIVGDNRGTVTGCHSTGSVNGYDYTGGIAGRNMGTVSVCSSSAAVTGNRYVGGIAGGNSEESQILDCYHTGDVLGANYVGGLAGQNTGAVSFCHNAGKVNTKADDKKPGGLLGQNAAGASIKNSYSHTGYCSANSINWDQGSKTATGKVGGASFKDGTILKILKNDRADAVWVQGTDYPVFRHIHYWYCSTVESGAGQTIELRCAAAGCDLANAVGGRVTISAPSDLIYSGNAKDALLTYPVWNLDEDEKPTVTYNLAERTNVTGSDIVASMAMNAIGATAGVTYQVQPRAITENMVLLSAVSLIYSGAAQGPSVAVIETGGVQLAENRDYTLSGTSGMNAGKDYEVQVLGMGNYTGLVKKKWAIIRASISPAVFLEGWTFGDAANTPVVTGNTGAGSEVYEYKAAEADDSAYTKDVPAAAGSYTLKVTIRETDNYEGGSATTDFVIGKKDAPDVSVAEQRHLHTVAASGSVDIAQKLPQDKGATVYEIAGTEGAFLSGVQISADGMLTYSTAAAAAPANGSITVKATMANYTDAQIVIPVMLDNKTMLTITPPAPVNGTYDGQTAHAGYTGNPVADGYDGTYQIIYSGRGDTDYAATEHAPVDAGDYTATFSIPAENLYYTGSASVDFSVAKAIPSGTPVFIPIYRDGMTLADAGLTAEGGTFSVAGTAAWDEPMTTVVEEGRAYAWTFTPMDSRNYETIRGSAVIYPAGDVPEITEPAQMQEVSARPGEAAEMSVTAQGTGELTYQWYVSTDGGETFEMIPGATQPDYMTDALTADNDGYQYYCLVSNLYGETASPVFVLCVVDPLALPRTGDENNLLLWMLLLTGSTALLSARRRSAA